MKKGIFLLIAVLGFFLVGCAVQQKPLMQFSPNDLNPRVKSGELVQTTDSLLMVMDASLTMSENYKGQAKLDIAKNFINRFNKTIPDIKLQAGFRTLGDTANLFLRKTALIYGMTDYTKKGIEQAFSSVPSAKGSTPLSRAIEACGGDLKSAPGNIAVVLVSDGKATDTDPAPAAKALKKQYGDRICIYTVLIGNDAFGRKNMENIANASGCGFLVPEDLTGKASGPGMASLVEKVFFTKRLDSDGDGVYDDMDKCPGTPRGTRVDSKGCPFPAPKPAPKGPIDSDKDGVFDDVDKCPGTPMGARVDSDGCWMIADVLFDTDKSEIKAKYFSMLRIIASVMKKNPGLKIEVQGNTDSKASAKYNMGLSLRRAKAVRAFLMDRGIDGGRLPFVGYGLTQPVASNLNQEGMALNRRVQFRLIK